MVKNIVAKTTPKAILSLSNRSKIKKAIRFKNPDNAIIFLK
jgi:hypothetical protein